jgi:hypothetical protein
MGGAWPGRAVGMPYRLAGASGKGRSAGGWPKTVGTTNGEPPFGVDCGGGAYEVGKLAAARAEARPGLSESGGNPSEPNGSASPPDVASAGC